MRQVSLFLMLRRNILLRSSGGQFFPRETCVSGVFAFLSVRAPGGKKESTMQTFSSWADRIGSAALLAATLVTAASYLAIAI